jgi:hypothetical protein
MATTEDSGLHQHFEQACSARTVRPGLYGLINESAGHVQERQPVQPGACFLRRGDLGDQRDAPTHFPARWRLQSGVVQGANRWAAGTKTYALAHARLSNCRRAYLLQQAVLLQDLAVLGLPFHAVFAHQRAAVVA